MSISSNVDSTTLFEGVANQNFTLSDDVKNYRFIEVYYGSGSTMSVKFYPSQTTDTTTRLMSMHKLDDTSSGEIFLQVATLVFSGRNVTYQRFGQTTVKIGQANTFNTNRVLEVKRVVGYR